MRLAEISFRAEVKELEKLEAQYERRAKALDKAKAKAEKYGVAEWTSEERNAWLATVEMKGFYIKNKEDVDKNGAWFNLVLAKNSLQETERALERCKERLEKKEEAYNEVLTQVEEEKIEKRDDLIKVTLEEMIKEWAKDGIKLEGANGRMFWGKTPQGKSFYIDGNRYGYTTRTLNCYSLSIDGETIFTSGLFWRAYHKIKNN